MVCGGSRGIGRAVSRLLAQRGCRLAVVSRNEDAARATAASLHGGMLWHTDLHSHAYTVYAYSILLNKRCKDVNVLNTISTKAQSNTDSLP